MTITPHVLIGAALATTTNIPVVAFLLGFLSHFLLDAIPHLEPGSFFSEADRAKGDRWPTWAYLFAICEFILVATVFYFLFHHRSDFIILCWGALGGITLDILTHNPFYFTREWPVIKQLNYLHRKLHYHKANAEWYWGALTTILLIGGSLCYLLRF